MSILRPALLLVICLTATPAFAAIQNWNVANGNWTIAANWSPAIVPLATMDAYADNGGTALVTTSVVARSLGAGSTNTSSGIFSVSGPNGLITLSGNAIMGDQGTGTLNLSTGGRVNAGPSSGIFLGGSAGGSGTLNIDGGGSNFSGTGPSYVGNRGTGTVNITNGGSFTPGSLLVGNNAGSTGTITVGGTGSNVTSSGTVTVGSSGTGTLNINSGGLFSETSGTFTAGLVSGATGTVNIDGVGSKMSLTNTTNSAIGNAGTGIMHITNGGNLVVNGGTLFIGSGLGTGTVTVDGTGNASTITGTGNITTGNAGTGTLAISNGGQVITTGNGTIGSTNTGIGTVTVDGAGSKYNMSALVVGNTGTGTLTVTNGGTVNYENAAGLYVGKNAGSTGTVTVDGPTSSISSATGGLNIGTGTGTVNVTGGGKLTSLGFNAGLANGGSGTIIIDGAGSTYTNNSGASLGQAVGSTGAMTVRNGGTYQTTNGFLVVGNGGSGTFNANTGAQVFTSLGIGFGGGSTGVANIDGPGTVVTSTSATYLGTSGTGTLNITNGALLTATGPYANLYFDSKPGITATLNIDNATANFLGMVAGSGTGNATISNGGTLNLTEDLTALANGGLTTITVTGPGSALNARDISMGANSGGTLSATNGGAITGRNLLLGPNNFQGPTLLTNGTLNLDGAGSSANFSGLVTIGGTGRGTANVTNGASLSAGSIAFGTGYNSTGNVLNIGNGGAVGAVTATNIYGTYGNNTINLNHNDAGYVLGANISGNLKLNQIGTGTTILTGEDTYYGATTISGGTLQVGNGGSSGNIANSAITDNSHLVFNRSGTAILNGIISGSGDVTQAGSGTIILANDQSYTGGTVISSGTLQIGNGGSTGSVVGNITDDSHLVFNHGAGVSTFNGVISGGGDVVKDGIGILKITQTQTYTGATHIEGGEIRAGAANVLGNTSALTVDPGAVFSMNGYDQTVGNVVNNGIINSFGVGPDANLSIGTLTGNGTFGLTTNMEGNFGDHIDVSGTSTGDHKLAVLNSGNAPANLAQTLELVSTTDSSTGGAQFSALGGKVDVGVYAYQVLQGNGSAQLPNTNNWYLAYAPGIVSEAAKAIVNTAAGLSDVWFTQLDNLHRRMGQQRLTDPSAQPYDTWIRGYAREMNVDTSVSGKAFDQQINGIDGGIDRVFYHSSNSTWLGGAFAGYGWADRTFNDVGSHGESQAPYGGLYATWFDKDKYYLDLITKAQRFNNTFDAEDDSGNIHHGDYSNWGLGGSVEVGRRFALGNDGWSVQPQAQVQYVYITGNDYVTRRATDVSVNGENVMDTRVGIEGGKTIDLSDGGVFYPYARVSLVDRFSNGGEIQADTLSFDSSIDGTSVEYGAGAIYQVDDHRQGYLALIASRGQHYDTPWGINAGFRYEF